MPHTLEPMSAASKSFLKEEVPIVPTRAECSDEGREASASKLTSSARRSTWASKEGAALPLGVTWIEGEQAFNFAVYAEHADGVILLLYSGGDLTNPVSKMNLEYL
ncbi:MAG: hypothetical protein JOZ43_00830, partial [Acidobacteriales bacterium]|nr:hypothetical protein [Terriglobales bacterium]